ncbi:MAG: hypothetical protein KAH23_01055 [Kiritimatiellae bacterium]|nr:hypothetical protein [Kiritimatiellia bacterium]
MTQSDKMVFQKFPRSRHLQINTVTDLDFLLNLDETLWVATGAPMNSLNCDSVFLSLLDTDDNNRIMCYEVKESIKWMLNTLSDRSGINTKSTSLQLNAINTDTKDGNCIKTAVAKILQQIKLPDATEISLDQVRKTKKEEEEKPVSAAGVAIADATESNDIKTFIEDIIKTMGGVPHPSKKKGITQDMLNEFLKHSKTHLDWLAKGNVSDNGEKSDVMPLADATPKAFAVYSELKEKIDEYFAQCRVAAVDAQTLDHVKPTKTEFESIDLEDPKAIDGLLKSSPLSRPDPNRSLPLVEKINPFFEDALILFRDKVAAAAKGSSVDTMTEHEWTSIKKMFAPRQAWVDTKAGAPVEKLGAEKLTSYQKNKFKEAVDKIIAESNKTALVLDNIRMLEKLILFQANMLNFVNNFTSFPLLYDPNRRAMFEMGTLIIDGRRLNFSVKAENRSDHSKVAKTSNIFVIYAEIITGNKGEKYELAIPVTSGSKGNLCIGKRGVFCDLNGKMFDAKVIQIIENPISIIEAMISPFQRLGALLTGKIEAMTSSAEKQLDTVTTSAIASPPPSSTGAAPVGNNKGMMAGGILMGGGVAIAALGSAMAYITNTLKNVEGYKIGIGVFLAILAVIAPASILALMKLRRRDLSAILEGSGWAINARMRLTLRQGRIFTYTPKLPADANRTSKLILSAIIMIISLGLAVVICIQSCGVQ